MSILSFLMSPKGLALDRWLVRVTGKSLLNYVFARNAGLIPRPALLLETIGRKSRLKRQAVLPYFDIENKRVIVGSKGGMPTDPDWVHNLRSQPKATIYVDRRKTTVTARFATQTEYTTFWDAITELIPTYTEYQQSAKAYRQIPIVILEIT